MAPPCLSAMLLSTKYLRSTPCISGKSPSCNYPKYVGYCAPPVSSAWPLPARPLWKHCRFPAMVSGCTPPRRPVSCLLIMGLRSHKGRLGIMGRRGKAAPCCVRKLLSSPESTENQYVCNSANYYRYLPPLIEKGRGSRPDEA